MRTNLPPHLWRTGSPVRLTAAERRSRLSSLAEVRARVAEDFRRGEADLAALSASQGCLWIDEAAPSSFDACCGAPREGTGPYCAGHGARAWVKGSSAVAQAKARREALKG